MDLKDNFKKCNIFLVVPPPPKVTFFFNDGFPNNKTQRVKVTYYNPLYLLSKKAGGQQEGEHG